MERVTPRTFQKGQSHKTHWFIVAIERWHLWEYSESSVWIEPPSG